MSDDRFKEEFVRAMVLADQWARSIRESRRSMSKSTVELLSQYQRYARKALSDVLKNRISEKEMTRRRDKLEDLSFQVWKLLAKAEDNV